MFFMLVQGQVPIALYLSPYNFYLSQTIGQSLMSSPDSERALLVTRTYTCTVDCTIGPLFIGLLYDYIRSHNCDHDNSIIVIFILRKCQII